MSDANAIDERLDGEELRRLWRWTMDAIPGADMAALRDLARALDLVVRTERGPAGKPVILKNGLPPLPVGLGLSPVARRGAVVALSQAVRGTSHPQRLPAPFGAVEHMILPLAEKLGCREDLERELGIG